MDEIHFHQSKSVNKKNKWTLKNCIKSQCTQKIVVVWNHSLWDSGVLNLFADNKGETVTASSHCYIIILESFVMPHLELAQKPFNLNRKGQQPTPYEQYDCSSATVQMCYFSDIMWPS